MPEYRTSTQRNPQAAQRVLDKFLKAHALLARSVKQLEEGRMVREEFRKTVPQIVQQCTSGALLSILPVIREGAERARHEVDEYVFGNLSADELRSRLLRYDLDLRNAVGLRMKAAMPESLKVEEGKVQG